MAVCLQIHAYSPRGIELKDDSEHVTSMLKTLRWFKHLHDLDPAHLPSLTYVHSLPPTLCFSNPDLLVSPRPPILLHYFLPLVCAQALCSAGVVAHPLQLAASPSKLSYHPLARLHTIPHFSVIPCNSLSHFPQCIMVCHYTYISHQDH